MILVVIGVGCLAFVLVVGVLASLLFPVFFQARDKARTEGCVDNLKIMSAAMLMYANDYDDKMPIGVGWMDTIAPYTMKVTAASVRRDYVFRCPTGRHDGPDAYGYALNASVAGSGPGSLTERGQTRMIFDSPNLQRNAVDRMCEMPNPPRHNGGTVNMSSYVDGHVDVVFARPAPQ